MIWRQQHKWIPQQNAIQGLWSIEFCAEGFAAVMAC